MDKLLASRFGPEWDNLPAEGKALVRKDFAGVLRDEYDVFDPTTASGVALDNAHEASREYRRRIGGGNLAAYAATLAAGRSL
jgi:hypothetical protein